MNRTGHFHEMSIYSTDLYNACVNGDLKKVKKIINKQSFVNYCWAFEEVCRDGNIELINLFIDPDKMCNNDWNNGLVGACHGGKIETVEFIIKKKFNLLTEGGLDLQNQTINFDWNGGLYYACVSGNIDIVKLIIKLGSDLDFTSGLRGVFFSQNIDIVDLMVEHGGDFYYNFSGLGYRKKTMYIKYTIHLVNKFITRHVQRISNKNKISLCLIKNSNIKEIINTYL